MISGFPEAEWPTLEPFRCAMIQVQIEGKAESVKSKTNAVSLFLSKHWV